ncbi:uncharacterized protein LOC135389548 [Ornithodoros turicata]|uniref:uncharacterized protein LOC135389548 n=1 Tax=Ornithodoros turicata TaxID=34597 RepID=UPI0031392A62
MDLSSGERIEFLGGEPGLLLLIFVVIVGAIFRMTRRVVNVPVLAVIVVWGFFTGVLVNKYGSKECFLPVTDFHINELLVLYMPVLVFTVAFTIRYHLFKGAFWQCCMLGGVGLVFSCSLYVLYMSLMSVTLTNSNSGTIIISFLVCCPEPMFSTDISHLTSGKSHILETLLQGEPLIGISLLWFVHHVFTVTGGVVSLSGSLMTLLMTLIVGPVFGKLVGHLLAYALISLSQLKLSMDVPEDAT